MTTKELIARLNELDPSGELEIYCFDWTDLIPISTVLPIGKSAAGPYEGVNENNLVILTHET